MCLHSQYVNNYDDYILHKWFYITTGRAPSN